MHALSPAPLPLQSAYSTLQNKLASCTSRLAVYITVSRAACLVLAYRCSGDFHVRKVSRTVVCINLVNAASQELQKRLTDIHIASRNVTGATVPRVRSYGAQEGFLRSGDAVYRHDSLRCVPATRLRRVRRRVHNSCHCRRHCSSTCSWYAAPAAVHRRNVARGCF